MQEMQKEISQVDPSVLKPPSRALDVFVGTLAIFLALGIAFFVGEPAESPVTRAIHSTLLVVTPTGSGSGIVIHRTNPSGEPRVFLWTAAHVAEGSDAAARRIFRVGNQKAGFAEFPAVLIAIDADSDLALYRLISPPELSLSATFSTVPAQPGDSIFHVGNFLGDNFDNSLTVGVVSQVGVHPSGLPGWPWALVDQTDTAVAPGGSGGGIFNTAGEVVGIMVGAAGPGISVFVPTRAVFGFAQSAGLGWAVYGDSCPPDSALVSVAELPPVELPEVP